MSLNTAYILFVEQFFLPTSPSKLAAENIHNSVKVALDLIEQEQPTFLRSPYIVEYLLYCALHLLVYLLSVFLPFLSSVCDMFIIFLLRVLICVF